MPSVLWTLLVGRQEGHPACKKLEWWGAGVVIGLERDADLHMAQLMPLPIASVKSRLVLPFWYRLTRVVPDKGPLNACVCVCITLICCGFVVQLVPTVGKILSTFIYVSCCVQHAAGLPSSYQLSMMSQQAAALPYPQAPSPALLQQYQYHRGPHGPPATPLRAPPLPAAHCSDYYIPVVHDQHQQHHQSYPPVNIPNSQPPPPQQPQCFTGVYDSRPAPPPASFPGASSLRLHMLSVH